MKKTIVLYIFSLLSLLCRSQEKLEDSNPKIIFKDTLNNFVYDSISNNLGNLPITNTNSRLIKHFKYIGKEKVCIVKAWTGDPHFICEYPTDLLIPNKIYSYTICFYNLGMSPNMSKVMGFKFSDESLVSFKFYKKYNQPIERIVSGVVVDSLNIPFPGANIVKKDSNDGTSTNFNGEYSIKAKYNDTLVFSFIGMKTQQLKADKNVINVQLSSEYNFKLEGRIPDDVSRRRKTVDYIGATDTKKANNAKYNFFKNSKRNRFIIFVPELREPNNIDFIFEIKHNIIYSTNFNSYSVEYMKKHNKLTFKHLKKVFNETWQEEIRKDAFGLDEFSN